MSSHGMPVFSLDSTAFKIIESVRAAAPDGKTGTNHWLGAVLSDSGVTYLANPRESNLKQFREPVDRALRSGDIGDTLTEPEALLAAQAVAKRHGRTRISSSDIARAVLLITGHAVSGPASVVSPDDLRPQAAVTDTGSHSILDQVGDDLTLAARRGELRAVLGREEELQTVIEVLLRSTKRNPVLVGPPGVGKTAIAEGLARRIAEGNVPELLAQTKLVSLHPGALLVGVANTSDLQERVRRLVDEASSGDVVLFIDEVHALVGLGGDEGRSDLATLLKPALARGDIACIAATTDSEYRRFIEADGALERRFQPIRVNEPGREVVMMVLSERAAELAEKRGVIVEDEDIGWIYDFAQRFLRSRYFPDKAIDLLEQAVARAAAEGLERVTSEVTRQVAERLVGMPVSVPERVEALRVELQRRGLLGIEEVESITENIHVRMRGFGVNPLRPNAIVLLLDEASRAVNELCATLASSLYGSEERIVSVDCSRFAEASSVTLLVGAPPSYVGYKDPVPLHELLQTPWSVVRLVDVHATHPYVRKVLETALTDGYFTDGSGRRIYLSDSVVVMTARSDQWGSLESTLREYAESLLGHDLALACDVIVRELPEGGEPFRRWLKRDLLAGLSARFERRGLTVKWDRSVVQWLASLRARYQHPLELQRNMDRELAHELIKHLPEESGVDVVTVSWDGTKLVVSPEPVTDSEE